MYEKLFKYLKVAIVRVLEVPSVCWKYVRKFSYEHGTNAMHIGVIFNISFGVVWYLSCFVFPA